MEETKKIKEIENNILNEKAIVNNSINSNTEYSTRMDKIKNWFSNPYNLALAGILIFALAIRIYYFWLTKTQAVWWDEGEYLLRVNHLVLDTPASGFFEGRELFTPYFWALILYIFKSEVAIRVIQVIISTLTVWAAYSLGKEVYDKKTGLIAAAIMSFFWLHLFFTCRLLTYLYAPLFYILALALFWKGYCTDDKHKDRYLYLSFITIILGLGIYSSITFAAFTILLYLLITEKLSFLKNKRLWKYGLLSLPFLLFSFIPSYLVQGSFIPRLSQMVEIEANEIGAGLAGLFTYPLMMPRLLLPVLLWALMMALILIVGRIILSFDLILKNQQVGLIKKDLFIFLVALIPFAFYTYMAMTAGGSAGAFYDAWILPVFPALFVLISRMLLEIKDFAYSKLSKEVSRKIIVLLIIAAIVFVGYAHIKAADTSIKGKISSYDSVKYAGEWLRENSNPGDIIISASLPQINYYSQRKTYPYLRPYPSSDDPTVRINESDFDRFMEEKKPRFLTDSLWESVPDWVHRYAEKHKDSITPVQAYYLDSKKTQLSFIIYEVKFQGINSNISR